MKRLFLICALSLANLALCLAAAPKIYINPGHGGYNSNDRNIVTINHASGDHDGFWESQANLTKGLYLRDMLQAAGATVYMSRTDNRSGYRDDKSISNTIGDRPLSTIAREASSKADFFLSIHSNAGGNSTDASVNYLLLMLTGTSGSSDWSTSYKFAEAKKAADYALTRMADHPMTWWSSSSKRMYSYTTYTVISPSYLTIPGYLSEGEFHDYKPETHRLLNDDYCKLEAYRLLQAFCDYYSSSLTRPTTGVICGDVRDNTTQMTNSLYKKASGTKDPYTPLNGAKVRLKDMSGNVLATYVCDDEWNGFYAFWDLAPGTYQVQCAATGHASVTNTVTVTANNISYNNVKLGSGSGDGMEDVVIPPLGVLYDTLINHSAVTTMESQTIRRALVKEDQLYVLTNDNTIHVVNANSGAETTSLSTSGISVNTGNLLNDIALTDDNVLLACQLERTTFNPSNSWQVFTWANDAANPTIFCQSKTNATSGNFTTANTGYTFCAKGSSSAYTIFTLAQSTGSPTIRAVSCDGTNTKYSKDDTNMTSSTIADDTRMVASPYGSGQFVLESTSMHPTLYSGTWIATGTSGNPLSVVSTLTLPDLALSGGTFITYDSHTLYITPYGSDNLGVGIYDATSGLGSATLIKTLYPETVQPLATAGYMTAAAQVDGTELVVTLYVQNRGIDRWRLSQDELEKTIVVPPAVPVSGANIFASELAMTKSGDTYTFSYRLNEDATDVTLQLHYEGTVIQSKSFGAQTKGVQSGTITESEIAFPARDVADHLTWAIKATARPINVLTKLSDNTTKYQFFAPYGVAVDMNPESDYFGRVYVTNSKSGTCSAGRATANGLFAFDAGLNALNSTAYTGGVSWGSNNSPFRLAVAEDGRVFLCDWADAHSGIWIAPAGGITGNFTELFAGLTRNSKGLATNSSSVPVHGSISGCWVEGSGADTKLYTVDEDYLVADTFYNMLRYDIGTATLWNSAPSAVTFANKANGRPLVNNVLNVVSDLHSGWWIIQHRFAETSLQPSMIHVLNGAVDYNTGGEQLLENSRNAGLAVNFDGSRIATTAQNQINVWDVTYDASGHLTDISQAFEITASDISGLGASSNDVAFDPAGNIYYVSNSSERLVVIGLPKADNSFVTPARSTLTIPLPAVPDMSVLITEWEQSGLTVDFGAAPTATGVVVKIGATQTATLALETLLAHTATGTAAANNNKHITLPALDLTSFAGQTMTLNWMASGVLIGQTQVTIPALIAGTSSALPVTDHIIVLPDATLTLDLSGSQTKSSLEIYPGGKLVLSNGTLNLTTLILRAGWTTAHTQFRMPKLYTASTAAVVPTNAYLDWVIDYAQYYPMAVPCAVTRSAITYRDYPSAPAATGVLFRQYDGAQRATGVTGSNWQNVTPTTLEPAVGYAIAAKRPASIMYCFVRMPLNWSSTQNTVAITAHGVGTGLWNNVGWNFIANPYLATFNGTDDASFAGYLAAKEGTSIRYATIPTADFQDYYQVPIDEAALEPMSPFFIQAAADGDVTFLAAQQNPTLAPASNSEAVQQRSGLTSNSEAVYLRLRFAGAKAFDQTYILLGDHFTDEPDFNADLPKEFGRAPKIWSALTSDNAALALPNDRLEYTIPLAVQTDAEGYFTFALSNRSELGDITRLELYDDNTPVANLMADDYRVLLPAGTITDRFALHIVRTNQVPTDQLSDSPQDGPTSNSVSGPTKRLQDAQVVIDYNGHTYDILGTELR